MYRSTGMGISIVLIAAGAILAWAVDVNTSGVNLNTVGVILLVVGLIGLVVSLIALMTPSRESHTVVDRDNYVVPPAGRDAYAAPPAGRERVIERERY